MVILRLLCDSTNSRIIFLYGSIVYLLKMVCFSLLFCVCNIWLCVTHSVRKKAEISSAYIQRQACLLCQTASMGVYLVILELSLSSVFATVTFSSLQTSNTSAMGCSYPVLREPSQRVFLGVSVPPSTSSGSCKSVPQTGPGSMLLSLSQWQKVMFIIWYIILTAAPKAEARVLDSWG